MAIKDLPDDVWFQILEIGTRTQRLDHRDVCSLAIANPRLDQLSQDPIFWVPLLDRDFRSFRSSNLPPSKDLYRTKFEMVTRIRYARKLKATLEKIENSFELDYPNDPTNYEFHKALLFKDMKEGRALWAVDKLGRALWAVDKLVHGRNSDKWTVEMLDRHSDRSVKLGTFDEDYKPAAFMFWRMSIHLDQITFRHLYEILELLPQVPRNEEWFMSPTLDRFEILSRIRDGISQLSLCQEELGQDKLYTRSVKEAKPKKNPKSQTCTSRCQGPNPKVNPSSKSYVSMHKPTRRAMPRKN